MSAASSSKQFKTNIPAQAAEGASALAPEWVVIDGYPVRVSKANQPPAYDVKGLSDDKQPSAASEGAGGPAASAASALLVPRSLFRVRHLMARVGAKGKHKTADPVVVNLAAAYVTTSAAATALSAVQALSPIGVADYSSFAALFDLWRVRGITVHFRLTGSATPAGSGAWALAFDPSNVGSYSGVDDVLTAQHHAGPMVFGIKSTTFPEPMNHSGYYRLKLALPVESRVTNDGAAANAVGGGWVGTSNTTAVVGWLKPYVNSWGPAITSTIEYYVVYEVEFKART